jgi:hypothetical protein
LESIIQLLQVDLRLQQQLLQGLLRKLLCAFIIWGCAWDGVLLLLLPLEHCGWRCLDWADGLL